MVLTGARMFSEAGDLAGEQSGLEILPGREEA